MLPASIWQGQMVCAQHAGQWALPSTAPVGVAGGSIWSPLLWGQLHCGRGRNAFCLGELKRVFPEEVAGEVLGEFQVLPCVLKVPLGYLEAG